MNAQALCAVNTRFFVPFQAVLFIVRRSNATYVLCEHSKVFHITGQ
jgi:hypothetical protein